MNYGRYTFDCSFLDHAALPEYKAAIFRDYLGYALKQAVCVLKNRTCNDCLLRPDCLYATVFESNQGKDSPYNESPHPFVIEPPETRRLRFLPNDAFSFHLLLFGDTTLKLPYFVHAATLMGEKGFGRRAGGHFVINSVRCGETVIYSDTDQMLHQPPVRDLTCDMSTEPDLSPGQLQVQFLTPLRLKHNNRLASHLPFHVLIRACLRRISTLFAAFGTDEPDLDYTKIVSDSQNISILKSSLCRINWKGYSFRQKQEIHLGGLVGNMVYEGSLTRFLPLLKFGRLTHIGKQTTFGLGRFDMTFSNTTIPDHDFVSDRLSKTIERSQ